MKIAHTIHLAAVTNHKQGLRARSLESVMSNNTLVIVTMKGDHMSHETMKASAESIKSMMPWADVMFLSKDVNLSIVDETTMNALGWFKKEPGNEK